MEDDCPYQPEGQLGVPIRYVIIPDVDQFDLNVCGYHQYHLGYSLFILQLRVVHTC